MHGRPRREWQLFHSSTTGECCHLPQRQGRVAASAARDVISICAVCFATAHVHVSVSARDHPPAFYNSSGQAKQIIRN